MNNLSIIVDAVYKGTQAFMKAQADVKKLDADAAGGAAKMSSSFKAAAIGVTAVGAALGAAALAGKQLYSSLREGAALITTRERFDKLSQSIDTTADALLGKLRTATKGMIDDMTLMSSASQIVSLGLATNEDQVTRLATVVGTLGWDMQQVILTFANLSTMRLDALGLSVESVKQRADELEKSGMSAAEAFKEAVIQAGEAKLDVGGVSDAEQAFLKAETAVKNYKDALTESIARTAEQAGLFDKMTIAAERMSLASEVRGLINEYKELTGQLWETEQGLTHMSADELAAEMANLQFNIDGARLAAEHQQLSTESLSAALVALGYTTEQVSAAEAAFIMATYGVSAAIEEVSNAALMSAQAADAALAAWGDVVEMATRSGQVMDRIAGAKVKNAIGGLPKVMNAAAEATRSYGYAVSTAITQEEALAAAHGRLADAFSQEVLAPVEDGLIDAAGVVNMEAANKALFQQAQAAGATAAQLALLGVATGQFTEEQAQAALKAAVLQEKIKQIAAGVASGQLSYGEAAGGLASFGEALNSGALGEVAGGIEGVAQAATDFASGTYEAELSVEDAAARTAIQEIIELIGQASGTFYTHFVVTTSEEEGGGSGSTSTTGDSGIPGSERMGGRSSYTVPMGTQTYQADYRSSTAAGVSGRGLTEYQGGATYNVTVNNFVDGKAAPKQNLDDVTVDKLRAALDSIGVRR